MIVMNKVHHSLNFVSVNIFWKNPSGLLNEDVIIQACSYKLANLSLDYNSRNLSEFSQSVIFIQCQAWPSLTSKRTS